MYIHEIVSRPTRYSFTAEIWLRNTVLVATTPSYFCPFSDGESKAGFYGDNAVCLGLCALSDRFSRNFI